MSLSGNTLDNKKDEEELYTFQSFNKAPEHLRLEEHIQLKHLHELRDEFENHRPETRIVEGESKYSPTKYEHREPGALNPQEFKDTIAGVLETRRFDDQLDKLFTKLDTSADGFVDWNEFATYMLLHYRENDYLRTKKEIPFIHDPKIRHILQNRQENTVKIISLDNPLRFLTINKDGVICIWSSVLHLERSLGIDQEDEDASGQRRRFKMWITDAIYLPNCHKLAIVSTCRDLRFYDVAGNQILEDYHIYGLNNVPHCLEYYFDEENTNGKAMLIWGDDAGLIHTFTFKTPVTQLFERAFTKNRQSKTRIYMQDIWKHERFVEYSCTQDVQYELIKRIRYIPENDAIITGSASPRTSVVMIDRKGYKKPYTFRLSKGVHCFDHSKLLNLLVTGAADHVVRFWNPYVPSKPVAVLEGHYSAVIDIVIYEVLEQVFSYSSDATLKVWDVKDHTCLQTILLKFPTCLHGHIPDHGPFPLLLHAVPGSTNSCLLVTCNDYIAKLRLGLYTKPPEDVPRTHAAPLCSAIYNEFFEEVVTSADDSSIIAWDFESGAKNLVFTNAHGDEEITCMAFDSNWRRLITGARNGTVKVWNFQNGHNLHKLEPVDDSEVTAVLGLCDRQYILTVGWSKKITKYDDSEGDSLYIEADHSWKGGTKHRDDILSAAYCSPYLLATASFDGEILVWTLETEKMLLRIKAGSPRQLLPDLSNGISFTETLQQLGSMPQAALSRPNSRHRPSCHAKQRDPVPVDNLLFLKSRVDARLPDSAVLVSSQAGTLKWWSIFGTDNLIGEFRASDFPGESVLAMACNKQNSKLVTGDTQGFLYVWDISDYCLKQSDQVQKSRPKLLHIWRGHDLAVISIEYVEHTSGDYVLTSSSDRTARLWAEDGKFIGTFGQITLWNVSQTSTWAHPLTPFCEEYLRTQLPIKSLTIDENTKGDADRESVEEILVELGKDDSNQLGTAKERSKDTPSTPLPRPDIEQRPLTMAEDRREWVDNDLRIMERARTFHTIPIKPVKSIIGTKAESEFLRSRLSRQERRGHFGQVDKDRTNRFGSLCCPFQALSTQEMSTDKLPNHLPVTNRMSQRGYTSDTLDLNTLKSMDLSIIIDDETDKKKLKAVKPKARARLPVITPRVTNTVAKQSV